jgi:hypothetical protein
VCRGPRIDTVIQKATELGVRHMCRCSGAASCAWMLTRRRGSEHWRRVTSAPASTAKPSPRQAAPRYPPTCHGCDRWRSPDARPAGAPPSNHGAGWQRNGAIDRPEELPSRTPPRDRPRIHATRPTADLRTETHPLRRWPYFSSSRGSGTGAAQDACAVALPVPQQGRRPEPVT